MNRLARAHLDMARMFRQYAIPEGARQAVDCASVVALLAYSMDQPAP